MFDKREAAFRCFHPKKVKDAPHCPFYYMKTGNAFLSPYPTDNLPVCLVYHRCVERCEIHLRCPVGVVTEAFAYDRQRHGQVAGDACP